LSKGKKKTWRKETKKELMIQTNKYKIIGDKERMDRKGRK